MLRGLTIAGVAHAGSYNFTSIPVPPGTPSGDYVQALSINDLGQVLVSALNASGGVDIDDVYNLHTQTFTAFPDYPGSVPNTSLANGINDSGQIVGQYAPPTPYLQAFSYSNGTFSTLTAGGTDYNFAISVSNNGMVTGDAGTLTTGLGYIYANGTYTYFSAADPTTYFTTGEGINDAGTVVGVAGPDDGVGAYFSFVDQGGVIGMLSAPGEAATEALGINDSGAIVGVTSNDGYATYAGFVDVGGVFDLVEAPGSSQTEIQGINDLGDIVGEYYDANSAEQVFIATPVPEPATWAMLLLGCGGLGAAMRSRRGLLGAAA